LVGRIYYLTKSLVIDDPVEDLARISHEHCVILFVLLEGQDILHKKVCLQIYTVFTKGQSWQRHLLQSFGNENSLLLFITKNFEPDAA